MLFQNSQERNAWLPRYLLSIYNHLWKHLVVDFLSSGSMSCCAEQRGETQHLGVFWVWCSYIVCAWRNKYNHWSRQCGASLAMHSSKAFTANVFCSFSEAPLNPDKFADEHLHGGGDVASTRLGWYGRSDDFGSSRQSSWRHR